MNRYFKKLSTITISCVVVGCAGMSSDTATNSALVGAGTGAVVGAGAGAAIGASISHGSVGKSALAGGLIGIPAGILAGMAAESVIERSTINSNESVIEGNYAELKRGQADLEAYREKVQTENADIQVDDSKRAYRYEGPSLGDYYQ